MSSTRQEEVKQRITAEPFRESKARTREMRGRQTRGGRQRGLREDEKEGKTSPAEKLGPADEQEE